MSCITRQVFFMVVTSGRRKIVGECKEARIISQPRTLLLNTNSSNIYKNSSLIFAEKFLLNSQSWVTERPFCLMQ